MTGSPVTELPIQRLTGVQARWDRDCLAIEAPLEIRLDCDTPNGRSRNSVSVTMRTPGHDAELAIGFLLGEGILRHAGQIAAVDHEPPTMQAPDERNVLRITLQPGVLVDLKRLERHFYTSSSCGVCSKTSIEALQTAVPPTRLKDRPIVAASVIHRLPGRLREAQAVFERTGGLHAAALFDSAGQLLDIKEDVGRHNAVDKVIGAACLAKRLPLPEDLLLVSGRASFELVQKAVMAGIPVLAAVGAPSSLAVALADEYDVTLLGFVRDDRFTIYTGAWRIREALIEGATHA